MGNNPAGAGVEILRNDPRFGFAWRTPVGHGSGPLLVVVHDSLRDEIAARDAFAGLVERHNISILAPKFPAHATSDQVSDGFKFLKEPSADYVRLLDEMLDQFGNLHRFDPSAVLLCGFSGGAQFAHRYALVRASRLSSLVIAAPGTVTLVDDSLPWWAGTANIEAATGYPLDIVGLRKLRVSVMVGSDDLADGLVARKPGTLHGSSHEGHAGATRRARAEAFAKCMRPLCVSVDFRVLDGVGHEFGPVARESCQIISQMLASVAARQEVS